MQFEVKFLTKSEMTKARDMDYRYEHVDDNNLGFADKSKNKIYIRAGLNTELTKYLISHEFEHLLEEEGTHEDEHGIRHKKFFKDILSPVYDPFNTLGTRGGHPFAGVGDALKGAGEGFIGAGGNPIGLITGAISGAQNQNKASYQGDSFSNMFGGGGIPQQNQASLGQGFGQTGSFSPSGMGPQGGQGAPMANIGLGAGLPNQANITMGGQGNQDMQQRQQGFWFPSYRF